MNKKSISTKSKFICLLLSELVVFCFLIWVALRADTAKYVLANYQYAMFLVGSFGVVLIIMFTVFIIWHVGHNNCEQRKLLEDVEKMHAEFNMQSIRQVEAQMSIAMLNHRLVLAAQLDAYMIRNTEIRAALNVILNNNKLSKNFYDELATKLFKSSDMILAMICFENKVHCLFERDIIKCDFIKLNEMLRAYEGHINYYFDAHNKLWQASDTDKEEEKVSLQDEARKLIEDLLYLYTEMGELTNQITLNSKIDYVCTEK